MSCSCVVITPLPASGCPKFLSKMLQVLEFPDARRWAEATTANALRSLLTSQALRDAVLWLEESKIRLWSVKDRRRLRETSRSAWLSGLERYVADLGLSLGNTNCNHVLLEALQSLVNLAIEDEYLDSLEAGRIARKETDRAEPRNSLVDVLEPLNAWLKDLDLPLVDTNDDDAIVCGIKAAVARGSPGPSKANVLDPDDFAESFETTMRLLHTHQLQGIQEKINDTVAALQLVTANPVTDSSWVPNKNITQSRSCWRLNSRCPAQGSFFLLDCLANVNRSRSVRIELSVNTSGRILFLLPLLVVHNETVNARQVSLQFIVVSRV